MNRALVASGTGFWALGVLCVACGGETSPTATEGPERRASGETAPLAEDTSGALGALFERHGARFAQRFALSRHASVSRRPEGALDVTLAERANAGFKLRDPDSNVAVSVTLVDARGTTAERVGDYTLYRGATPAGAALIQHVTATGTEDFVELPSMPPGGAVDFDLRLEPGVAGLRLVGNSLELLDPSGTPRIHVAPPYVVGSDGKVVRAELAVEGCAVDRDPSAPWARAPLAPGADTCRLSVRFAAEALSYPALLDPSWNSAGELAGARTGAQAALLKTGRVLVAGGRDAEGTALDSAELYDPATRTWASTGSFGTARAEHTLTLRPNGQALVVGGRDATGEVLSTSELYDAASGAWSPGAPLAGPHADQRAVVLTTGDVLIAGGKGLAAEKLSNRTSTWSSAGSLVRAATGHTLTLLADGRALLVGGAQAQVYDATNSRWLPSSGASGSLRQGHTATRLSSGQVLVLGEESPTTELFTPASGSWSRPGAAVTRRSGHTATLLGDGRVLVVGGAPAGTSAFLATEIYTPDFGTFAPGPSMLVPRRAHVEALLPSGKVLIAGGTDPTSEAVLASAEEFDPRTLAASITEYKLPARIDPAVLSDRFTELWASVTRPATLLAGKRYPLLVFLHGNHGTCGTGTNPRHDFSCQYTDSGTCPSGYVVTPNHRGYDYMTSELAGRGFIVVSINANRGINCAGGAGDDFGLNLARGRLILRHLEALSSWNRGTAATPASVGVSLRGALDLGQVGFFGHSRGGEGVRAAYEQYQDSGSPWPARLVDPLTVRAVFEVGPVDGQSSRVLNANGASWNVLLPMCDGDVSDLEGIKPFDRMIQNTTDANRGPKSSYTVWGANHNFYNTEWQDSDSGGCTDHRALFSPADMGSAEQRQTAMLSVVSFFAANVGTAPNRELEDLFDPEHRVAFDSPVQRGYAPDPTATKQLEEFTRPAGTSSAGIKNTHSRVTVVHRELPEHDSTLRGAIVTWASAGSSTYFQVNLAAAGAGVDLRSYALLDFRVDRPKDPANIAPSTSFEVALVNPDGSLSDLVSPASFADPIVGPAGGPYGNYHEMMQTVRLPLSAFGSANLASVRGVRFVFRGTPSGSIHLANLRATRSTASSGGGQAFAAAATASSPAPAAVSAVTLGARALPLGARVTSGNRVVSLRTTSDAQGVDLALSTGTPFVPRGELLELRIGGAKSVQSRHPSGNLGEVTFTLEKAAFDALAAGQAVSVGYAGGSGSQWDFGALDKSRLDR